MPLFPANSMVTAMDRIPPQYRTECRPLAEIGARIQGERYRFTVLTPFLLRLEYNTLGQFEDRASQTVLNRDFPVPVFRVRETESRLEIITEALRLSYDKQEFSPGGLHIQISGNLSAYAALWHYGDEPHDLGGTARTLDFTSGPIPLGHGLASADGWSLLDDGNSLLLTEDGWVEPRPASQTADLYFFGYGRDYPACLRDFYRLTGSPPLLPRYALGNWWSRYYRYSEGEYKELMERFEREAVPFTVAVIDMDWHITDIDPKYGSGWTGYSWNRELFPDPAEFMGWLHQKGLRVTLNIHPADGVRAFEDGYPALAAELGVAEGEPIPFDVSDPQFLEAYFRLVLRPHEDMGADFWWIDWQQGSGSALPGLDPLWMLNHFSYLDGQRRGKRSLTFSRYAGPGSHRYPVGFSGDSLITWEELQFQPYFTVTAANIGYGWWSHDIGGHMCGVKDDEMATRWLQFGVFSPIMRLHSSSSPFNGKEPWRFGMAAQAVMKDFLRLRHRMLPYLYTMNRFSHRDGTPLLQPLYYRHPDCPDAFHQPNEYYFGSELIACPITCPEDAKLCVARFAGWLPEGLWVDYFTGVCYTGGRRLDFYRPLEQMPLFGRAGGILPLSGEEGNAIDNPARLELCVFAGADGSFCLWEDDGESLSSPEESWAGTRLRFEWGETARLTVQPAEGNLTVLPPTRAFSFRFLGVEAGAEVVVSAGGRAVAANMSYDPKRASLLVEADYLPIGKEVTVSLGGVKLSDNKVTGRVFDFLNRAQMEFNQKEAIFRAVQELETGRPVSFLLSILQAMHLEPMLLGALTELLSALTA